MPRLTVGAVVALVAAAVFAAPAYAGGARSFVSGGGTDSGTCERAAPCRTFGYAITQTTARGEVVAIDSSGYGPVTITKAISLIAPKGVHAGISPSSGDAITVNADTSDQVVLRNLYLNGGNGASTGVRYSSARAVVVEDCVIANFAINGIFSGADSADAAQLTISDTVLRGNANAAVSLANFGSGSVRAQIDHTRAALGGAGFLLQDNARATITDSIATRNTGVGFNVSGNAPHLFMERDTATGNNTGIATGAFAQVVVSNSTIVDNTTGVAVFGGQVISRVNNTLTGNDTDGAFTGTLAAAFRAPEAAAR
jgi:hypothetical protein